MVKKKVIVLTPEQQTSKSKENAIKDFNRKIDNIGFKPNERKTFIIGEEIITGMAGHKHSVVLEILDQRGLYWCKTLYRTTKPYSSEMMDVIVEREWDWWELNKKVTEDSILRIPKPVDLKLRFYNTMMDSLIRIYFNGIDMNPSYQRDYVWSLDDKINLINSIFSGIELGKFVLIQLPYKENGYTYEILDGKQRLNTIIEFYTDQFTYQGKYYSELSLHNQDYFENFSIAMAMSEKELSLEQKLLYFLRLNTSGKIMDQKHLDKVQDMLKNI